MSEKQLIEDLIFKSLQLNLHQLQTKYEYFKKMEDISQYQDKISTFQNWYKSIEEDTNHLLSLIESGKMEEVKTFYYQTYKKDFEAILPMMDFFALKPIERFK